MGGKNAPDPPDYRGAAQEQAQASREITTDQTYANRPTQITPWGQTSWTSQGQIDPATGQRVSGWTQETTLNPLAQEALDQQMALQAGRSNIAGGMYDRVADEFGGLVDFDSYDPMGGRVAPNDYGTEGLGEYGSLGTGGLPGVTDPSQLRQQAEDAAYGRFTSRLDPRFEQEQQRTEAQLRNQGLRPGDQAYDTAMANFERGKTDAYQQAAYGASEAGRGEAAQLFGQESSLRGQLFGERGQVGSFQNMTREQQLAEMLRTGGAEFAEGMKSSAYDTQRRQQQVAEEMQRRGYSLNEINALLTGQQVSMPNMPDFSQATKSETPQYLNAADMGYQGELNKFGSEQAAWQGLMQGGLSLASAPFMPF